MFTGSFLDWVAVKEVELGYYNQETPLFTICPYYSSSLTAAKLRSISDLRSVRLRFGRQAEGVPVPGRGFLGLRV